jgi:hypothetical protein
VRIDDGHVDVVASPRGFGRATSGLGQWFGLDPEDAPLVLCDVGTDEVYASDWDAP